MSYALYPAAWRAQVDSTTKLVLFCLIDHAAADGSSVYPSVGTIAAMCGLKARSVQAGIHRLLDLGAIHLVRHEDAGARRAREYRIDLAGLDALSERVADGRITCTQGVHLTTSRGALNAPKSAIEPTSEPYPPKPPTGAVGDGAAFAEFWDVYPHRDGLLDPEDDARIAFRSAIDAGTPAAEIIAGAETFAAAVRANEIAPARVHMAKNWLAKKGWRSGGRKKAPASVRGTAISIAAMGTFLATDPERRDWEMAVSCFNRTGEWRGRGGAPGTPDYIGPADLIRAASVAAADRLKEPA